MSNPLSLSIPLPKQGEFSEWVDQYAYDLVDWLELSAFLNEIGQVFLIELVNALDLCWDQEEDDIHKRDQILEDISTVLSDEIDCRSRILGGSYPFEMMKGGFSFIFTQTELNGGNATYLLCLMLSHATQSEILGKNLVPPSDQLYKARNALFEGCSTLAASSICHGPSFRLGALRGGAERLLEKLQEIWSLIGDGKVRTEAHADAPKNVNDGDIDVISFTPMPDKRAGTFILYGQAASGHNWDKKEVSEMVITRFHRDWFDEIPSSKISTATFIPFRLSDQIINRNTNGHGIILDRLRLPYFVNIALLLIEKGNSPVECAEVIKEIIPWIEQQKKHMKNAVLV